ncbi:MAG: GNAT family N-acetyltransferase [Armatimonadota bacterium]
MKLRDKWPGSADVRDLLIRMDRPHLRGLPQIVLPDGYELRTAWPGFEAAWAMVMNAAFDDAKFTAQKCRQTYSSKPDQFDFDGAFFVMHGDEPVSSAFAWLDEPGQTEIGRVHWVGTVPAHAGKGLGRAVTLAVLHRFAQRGFRRAFLETQPYRLPAIRVYLRLGFQPNPKGLPEHEKAWEEILAFIAESERARSDIALNRGPNRG